MDTLLRMVKESNNTFKIEFGTGITERIISKLKIFLKSLNCDEVIRADNYIIVGYNDYDFNIISADLNKLIDFYNHNSIKYIMDDEVDQIVNEFVEKENNFKERIELLESIKNDTYDQVHFEYFKTFCDNHLSIKLRDYQYKSAYLLSMSKVGFDFSVPGAGKTIITYAAYEYMKNYDGVRKILIIGPKNAYNAWHDEYITCFGKEPSFKNLSEESVNDVSNYLCVSMDNFKEINFINIEKIKNVEDQLIRCLKMSKTLLVIDEGHKVKNPNAQSTKVAMELGKYTENKIILTGTPMPNGYEDLFSLTNILSPNREIIPYNYSQLKSFSIHGISGNQKEQLMKSLLPYYSRVSKKFLIERGELLPTNSYYKSCEMSEEQRYLYEFLDGLCVNIYNKWEASFNLYLMRAILIRKMQVSANPKLLSRSLMVDFCEMFGDIDDSSNENIENMKLKLQIADEELNKLMNNSNIPAIIGKYANEELLVNKNKLAVDLAAELVSKGQKVIVWDIFVSNMETLYNMIKKQINCSVGIINGNVTGEERQKTIDDFKNGEMKILIASPATLAESISLHKCCQNAIYVNRNYNAAQFIQSKDRIHRINMPIGKTATYYYLSNNDSVDDAVAERLSLKENRMLEILDVDEISIGSIDSTDNSSMSDEDVLLSYNK